MTVTYIPSIRGLARAKTYAVLALVLTAFGSAIAQQSVDDRWEATIAADIWGDPTGLDLISHGHWHERGKAPSDDPILVFRCRKGKPLSAHVDWRQSLSPGGPLAYEVRGGPRLHTRVRTSERRLVMFILEPQAMLKTIAGHTHVAVFSDNGGLPLSARFFVKDIGVEVSERCDPTAQLELGAEGTTEPTTTEPIYVTGDITKPVQIKQVEPEYTDAAKRERIQGVVILQAVINETGDVENVKVLKSLPHGLAEAAVDALKRSKFRPATRNGVPVAVYYNSTVLFQLQ